MSAQLFTDCGSTLMDKSFAKISKKSYTPYTPCYLWAMKMNEPGMAVSVLTGSGFVGSLGGRGYCLASS